MALSEAGEGRVRGYLFVLGRALRSFLPEDFARDAVREVESHIRERLDAEAAAGAGRDEAALVERVLRELGPPLRVAQAYSAEIAVDEAVVTGRLLATARALWALATATVAGFFAALALFVGYVTGLAFLALAALKPIFPENVGLIVKDGVPRALGGVFPLPPGAEVRGGYAIIPFAIVAGLAILVATQRGARAFLAGWRRRREESGLRRASR